MAPRTPASPASSNSPEPSVPVVASAKAPAATPASAPAAETPAPVQAKVAPSALERLRRNRMGALLGGLVVAIALGLLLSIFVPDSHVLLALVVLGLAESIAVGFTVRYLTACRGWSTQLTAFVTTAIGVHLMVTTGMVNQAIDDVGSMVRGLLDQGAGAASGVGWDDAVIASLATPSVSTGAIVCGLIAAIIAGWGVSTGHHHVHETDSV